MKYVFLAILLVLVVLIWYVFTKPPKYKSPPFVGTFTVYDRTTGDMLVSWNVWEGDTQFEPGLSPYRLTFDGKEK